MEAGKTFTGLFRIQIGTLYLLFKVRFCTKL